MDEPLGHRSIYQAMLGCWREPECGDQDSLSHVRQSQPPVRFKACYKQVLLAALRHFPYLSNIAPRCERGQKAVAPPAEDAHIADFLRESRGHGFLTRKVEKELTRLQCVPGTQTTPPSMLPPMEIVLKRRCGRPFANSYQFLRSTLFLDTVLQADGHTNHPTTLFIQRDFLRSIFGEDPITVEAEGSDHRCGTSNSRFSTGVRSPLLPAVAKPTDATTVLESGKGSETNVLHPRVGNHTHASAVSPFTGRNAEASGESWTMYSPSLPRRESWKRVGGIWDLAALSPTDTEDPDHQRDFASPTSTYDPSLSLPSASTSFSTRSLILPAELRNSHLTRRMPTYIEQYDGDVTSPQEIGGSRDIGRPRHTGLTSTNMPEEQLRSGTTGLGQGGFQSIWSDSSSRSIFGPEDL